MNQAGLLDAIRLQDKGLSCLAGHDRDAAQSQRCYCFVA
jgi:hypothetical protein